MTSLSLEPGATLPRWRGALLVGAPLAACVAALVGHAWQYLSYFPDDAYISLRYAKRLVQGHGLTWTAGERVEGYTNFLWVMVMSALGALRADYVGAARAVGAISLAAAMAALFFAHRPKRLVEIAAPSFGALAIAAAPPVGAYAMAGLEHPLSTALLAWAIVLLDRDRDLPELGLRRLWLPGLLLGLCSITRADAALLVAATVLGLVLSRGLSKATLRAAAELALVSALVFGAHLAFRRLYYHDWVPNTAHAKVALTSTRIQHGLEYFRVSSARIAPLWLPLAVAVYPAVKDRAFRARLMLPVVPLLFWCAYVVFIGGDNMEMGRHFVPVVVLLSIITALTVAWLVALGPRPAIAAAVTMPAVIALLGLASYRDPTHKGARGKHWNWNGKPVGLFLKRAFGGKRPLLATSAAGALPFYAELPALDTLGLNDRYLATHPPPSFGHGKLAHELGDGAYVYSRQPDLVVFGGPLGGQKPVFFGDLELIRQPDFHRRYRLIAFHTRHPVLTAKHWVRIDGPIGVKRAAAEITIPGFLLAGDQGAARLDAKSRLGAHVTPEQPGLFELEVPPGSWRAHVEAESPVRVGLARDRDARGEAVIEVDGARPKVVVRVEASEPTHVYRVTLTPPNAARPEGSAPPPEDGGAAED